MGGAIVGGLAFAMAAVVPTVVLLREAARDDPTATGSAGSLVGVLVAVLMATGAGLGLAGWFAGSTPRPSTRGTMSAIVLVAAGAAGLVLGFLGGVAITLQRHPTWDDA